MPFWLERVRFIPAPAGNRYCHRLCWYVVAVHPRACGEQASCSNSTRQAIGSSPRLRGTEAVLAWVPSKTRFIPAPAGNSSICLVARGPSTVHPRACGEQCPLGLAPKGVVGSSPRLRGTVCEYLDGGIPDRFIPAPAGNRDSMRSRLRPGPVHPRACGEQWKVPVFRDLGFGSSPRLRGTEAVLAWVPSKTRFIPAPAGNRILVCP